MSQFKKIDVAELLGITSVSKISDEELWTKVVTPVTRGQLGPIVRSDPPRVIETTAGLFPGDDVSNLNDHRLYGGMVGFIRNPYVHSFYKTVEGAFVVKRDGVKVELFCFSGDVEQGKGELMLKIGLRDRRFDGTSRADDSALLDFSYSHPVTHKPLSAELKSVEISVYAFAPGSRLIDSIWEPEYEQFVHNPFQFMSQPKLFLTYFERVWKTKRAPGQIAAPVRDVSRLVLPALEALARSRGYDMVETAPSHYHVARWFQGAGYRFSNSDQAKTFAELTAGLEKIRSQGTPLTKQQQAWVCVIQSLRPAELIPAKLNMNGPIWPQNNMDNVCLWMHKPLSEKAKKLLLSPAA